MEHIAPTSIKKALATNSFLHIFPVPIDAAALAGSQEIRYWSGTKRFNAHPTAAYPYHTADGGLFAYMVRWDIQQADGTLKKETRPFIYAEEKNGERGWKCKGPQEECVLYNLPEIMGRPDAAILVVEGEKTAEAAKLLFPNLVVTATLFGALAPHKTDWSTIKGREVIISPDFDSAGIKYGDAVCNLCKKAGAKSVKLLSVETIAKKMLGKGSIPSKYDIADAVKDGLSKEVLEASGVAFDNLLSHYFTQMEIQSRSLPEGFHLSESGSVIFDGDEEANPEYLFPDEITSVGKESSSQEEENDSNSNWLCSYLVVTHLVRDKNNASWSKVVSLQDRKGNIKEIVIKESELVGDGNTLKERLVDLGLRVNFFENIKMKKKSLLKYYLTTSNPKVVGLSVDRTGWHGQSYVLSEDRVYGGNPQERIIFDTTTTFTAYKQLGKLKDWQDTIGKWTVGNSRLQFSILAALAAPVLDSLGEDNFGIHFVGGSSIGKTTALQVASSIWGKEIKNWRTTDNASESSARHSNDGLLILDELSQVSGDAADAMIYMLGNGSGKARANKFGDARPIATFRLIFLSSGEVGLEAKISESKSNKKLKAGQTVRFIEIPADAGQGLGTFDTIHHFEDPGAFAIELKELTKKYQGSVIDVWLIFLTQNLEYHITQIRNLRKIWLEENPLEKAVDGQVERVKNKIALMAAVGEHASSQELQLLPWGQREAFSCCSKIFNAWLNQRGGIGAFEITQVIDRLVHFITEHGNSRFENAWGLEKESNDEIEESKAHIEKTINRVGFRKIIEDSWTYYFEPSAFEKEILQSGDKKTLLVALASKGVFITALEKAKDGIEKTRYTVSTRVPGFGQKRLYQISKRMLEKFSDSAL